MFEQSDPEGTGMAVLVTVVDAGSFTRGAEQLGLQKSSVSRKIRQLEERLGVQLIHRTTRKLRLTEIGQLYYERAVKIIADIKDAERMVTQAQQQPKGTLRITTTQPIAELILPPVIQTFLDRYPATELHVELSKHTEDLMNEGFDLAIRVGTPPDRSTLFARRLTTARPLYTASVDYLQRRGRVHDPEQLKHHDCIVLGEGEGPVSWPFVGPNGRFTVSVQGRLKTGSFRLAQAVVTQHGGIARLPRDLVAEDLAAGRLVPVLSEFTPPSVDVHAVYLGRREKNPLLELFLEVLEGYMHMLPEPAINA